MGGESEERVCLRQVEAEVLLTFWYLVFRASSCCRADETEAAEMRRDRGRVREMETVVVADSRPQSALRTDKVFRDSRFSDS
jgi:hypothetical protein